MLEETLFSGCFIIQTKRYGKEYLEIEVMFNVYI